MAPIKENYVFILENSDPRDPGSKKPVTELRNFYTSPIKKGQRNSDNFGKLNPLASSHIKDEFIEPNVRLMKEEK